MTSQINQKCYLLWYHFFLFPVFYTHTPETPVNPSIIVCFEFNHCLWPCLLLNEIYPSSYFTWMTLVTLNYLLALSHLHNPLMISHIAFLTYSEFSPHSLSCLKWSPKSSYGPNYISFGCFRSLFFCSSSVPLYLGTLALCFPSDTSMLLFLGSWMCSSFCMKNFSPNCPSFSYFS